jgi:hypothetical protein
MASSYKWGSGHALPCNEDLDQPSGRTWGAPGRCRWVVTQRPATVDPQPYRDAKFESTGDGIGEGATLEVFGPRYARTQVI